MNIVIGNAAIDGELTRQWIVGNFMPEGDLRKTEAVEIKWAFQPGGKVRPEWVTSEVRTTIAILISGRLIMEFREQSVELNKPGDYVMWGIGLDHRWKSLEDNTTVTIRWPSIA